MVIFLVGNPKTWGVRHWCLSVRVHVLVRSHSVRMYACTYVRIYGCTRTLTQTYAHRNWRGALGRGVVQKNFCSLVFEGRRVLQCHHHCGVVSNACLTTQMSCPSKRRWDVQITVGSVPFLLQVWPDLNPNEPKCAYVVHMLGGG